MTPSDHNTATLPWWTWVAPFFLILIAKLFCIQFFYVDGFFYLYGSYVVALPLYFMWGPRVLFGNIIAESITSNLVGIHSFDILLIHGLANAAKPLIGYESYKMIYRAKVLRKINTALIFLVIAILIPALLINPILIGLRVGAGDLILDTIFPRLEKQVLRDLLWGMVLCYPFLKWCTPYFKNKNLSLWPEATF
ncbi:MAG: hypothetical protein J7501_04625 [Bdellovibrio sp.]|nr:hypothetical protein [Bdellovibrio sp.]